MAKMIGSCGCEIKNVMWEVSIPDYDKKGNPVTAYLSVCSKCYHNFYKRHAIEAKREPMKYFGVLKTGEEWMLHFEDAIKDLKGWSSKDKKDFFKIEISYNEYLEKLAKCKIKRSKSVKFRLDGIRHSTSIRG